MNIDLPDLYFLKFVSNLREVCDTSHHRLFGETKDDTILPWHVMSGIKYSLSKRKKPLHKYSGRGYSSDILAFLGRYVRSNLLIQIYYTDSGTNPFGFSVIASNNACYAIEYKNKGGASMRILLAEDLLDELDGICSGVIPNSQNLHYYDNIDLVIEVYERKRMNPNLI